MQSLIAAINAHHTTQLGAHAHVIEVKEGTRLPYTVVSIISETASRTFTSTSERTLVQFDVYAADKKQALSMAEALKTEFDDCTLEVAGYSFGKFEREFSQPLKDGEAWRVIIQYAAELQKL